MPIKNQKLIYSFIFILIVIPTILFFIPKKAHAVWGILDTGINADSASNIANGTAQTGTGATTAAATTANAGSAATSTGIQLKVLATQVYQETLKAIAQKLLQQMTKSTINWINSGFHGSPLFLENPSSFFQDIAKSEVKNLVTEFGYDPRMFPFGRDWALNAISSYQSTLANNAAYTLDNVMTPDQVGNFAIGGWNGFLVNTQYPQNNYLGFNMIATQELAKRVQGTFQTAAEKVQTALQQGGGFLSPQACPSNLAYNNGINEFQKPQFQYDAPFNQPKQNPGESDDDYALRVQTYINTYNSNEDAAKAKFYDPKGPNICPGGLVNTTPGSVVGSQIAKALGGPQDQASYSAMVGNSVSAIFDSLLNHFIGEGLDSLASKTNPPQAQDNWTFQGQSLNSSNSANSTWDSGPDETINLFTFKKQLEGADLGTCSGIKNTGGTPIPDQDGLSKAECMAEGTISTDVGTCSGITDSTSGIPLVDENNITQTQCNTFANTTSTPTWTKTGTISGNTPLWTKTGYVDGDIDNTETEIRLMDNPNPDTNFPDPGILQQATLAPALTKTLDQCLPGPDKGWETRLEDEANKQLGSLQASFDTNPDNKPLDGISNDLKFAVTALEDWITNKMMSSLPDAPVYMDEIKNLDNYAQQVSETTDARRAKSETLSRLQTIAASLDTITTQPDSAATPPDPNFTELVSLKQQYDAIAPDISTSASIASTNNDLLTLNEKIDELKKSNTGCVAERAAAGWGPFDTKGNGLGVFTAAVGKMFQRTEITTKLQWTSSNVGGGLLGFIPTTTGKYIDNLDNYTFPTPEQEPPTSADDPNAPPNSDSTSNAGTTGTEIEQFCELPIISGYSHGDIIEKTEFNNNYRNESTSSNSGPNPDPAHDMYTFRNLNNYLGNKDDYGAKDAKGNEIVADYTGIPLVNAQYVLGDKTCTGLCSISAPGSKESDERKSINLDCKTIFKATDIEYSRAGNLSF